MQNSTTKSGHQEEIQSPFYNYKDARNNLQGCSTVQSMGLISTQHVERDSQVIRDDTPSQIGMALHDIKSSYKDVFEGLGFLGPELHLELDDSAKRV